MEVQISEVLYTNFDRSDASNQYLIESPIA